MNRRPPQTAAPGTIGYFWTPTGIVWLAVCVVALAAGLWPHAIRATHSRPVPAPLPTLQALLTGQAAFVFLVYPLILLRRRLRAADPAGAAAHLGRQTVEMLGMLLSALPLHVAAVYLADATPTDALRGTIALVLLWPAAWAAAACMAWRRVRPGVLLVLLLACLAMPAAWYVVREFLAPASADYLLEVSPLTYIWRVAASRQGRVLPDPLWPGVVWLLVAGGGLSGAWLAPRRRTDPR